MRVSKLTIFLTLLVFGAVGVFGLYLTSAMPSHHDAGCSIIPETVAICDNSLLTHLGHWQSLFTVTLASFFTLLAIVVLAFVVPFKLPDKQHERLRTRPCVVDRPPLLQELFSQGILHPKAP